MGKADTSRQRRRKVVNSTQRANDQFCKLRPRELGHPAPPCWGGTEERGELGCRGEVRWGREPEVNNQATLQGPERDLPQHPKPHS